jgi:hypothetical protein
MIMNNWFTMNSIKNYFRFELLLDPPEDLSEARKSLKGFLPMESSYDRFKAYTRKSKSVILSVDRYNNP